MEDEISIIHRSDKNYPALLKELPEKAIPERLFVRGTLPPSDALAIAIVGTRRATQYGKEIVSDIVRALAPHRVVIISGLALGIDGIAHRAALESNLPTIGVLGSGISNSTIYPREHLLLAQHIISSGGAIISEYEPDTKAARWTFPQRNRIIAGIAQSTIVIEADEKSGARITARLALDYGRDVFALPGSVYQRSSRGTNALLKEGAIPIINPQRVAQDLGLEKNVEIQLPHTPLLLNELETHILRILSEERTIDEIVELTKCNTQDIIIAVTGLEIRGMIKELSRGRWRSISS